jgi:hypothetical protein
MGRTCSTHGKEKINAYTILVENPEGRRTLGRYGRRHSKVDRGEYTYGKTHRTQTVR